MTSMPAVVLDEWGGELSVQRVAKPEPGPGEVRVDVKACGVTRTVENAVQGGLGDDPSSLPRVPGHEFSGVVDAVGERVTSVGVGDRVIAYFYLVCGVCGACRRGETNRCREFGGYVGVDRDGAYAAYATIPAFNALPLPDDASFIDGAIAADGLSTPLHVCERTGVDDTDTLAIIGGAGRIGVNGTQLAAARNADVLSIDVTDDRLAYIDALATDLGIDDSVTAVDGRGDLTTTLRDATDRGTGPTVVIDAVGDIETLEATWEVLAMGGRVVGLTTHHDRRFSPPLKEFVAKDAELLGSRYATRDDVVRAAKLLADGTVSPRYTERLSMDDVPAHHEALRAAETHGMAILEP